MLVRYREKVAYYRCVGRRTERWKDGRTDRWMDRWKEQVCGGTDTWMLRWMDEWIGSWTHGWNRVVTGQPSLGAVCGVTRVNGVTATSGPPCRHVPAEVPRPI